MPSENAAGRPDATTHSPPDHRGRALHLVLVLSDVLGQVQPLALTPAWLALAAIAAWPWGELRLLAGAQVLTFIAVDGAILALLPQRGRSYGPVTPPLLVMAAAHASLTLALGSGWHTWTSLLVAAAANAAITGALYYGSWVEPFGIELTRAQLRSPKLGAGDPVRLLHLSDLHVERISPRERALVRLAKTLAPDVVVLTGDYLNLSYVEEARAQAEAREFLEALCEAAHCPVYAITGSPPVDLAGVVPEAFEGLPIVWLRDEIAEVRVRDHVLRVFGLRCTRERSQDVPRLRRMVSAHRDERFSLLLYHSPDLMPEAAELGVDLYLCGHTHGGQIRLPLFGALITSSDFWKRYEMGRYVKNDTTLYVSRGLGMEGLGAPRVRFLAPPEAILWTLSA